MVSLLLFRSWGIRRLVCMGGFRNVRTEYSWQGLLLELDETRYEWGTLYELECETVRSCVRVLGGAEDDAQKDIVVSYSHLPAFCLARF